MIVEETNMLDQLWQKVSDQLKGEGYATSLTVSEGPARPKKAKRKGKAETPKEIFLRLIKQNRFDRIPDHELPEEPFELKLGGRIIRGREAMRAVIQEYKS